MNRALAGVMSAFVGAGAIAHPAGQPVDQAAGQGAVRPIGDVAAEQLALIDWTVQTPAEQRLEDGAIAVGLTLDDEARTFDLRPYRLRGDGFKIMTSDGAGGLVQVDAAPSMLYRGTTESGGVVFGSRGEAGWSLMVAEGAKRWFAEPVADFEPAAPNGAVVVYDGADVVTFGGDCGTADEAPLHGFVRNAIDHAELPEQTTAEGGLLPGEVFVAQVGIDCDFPFFQRNGSSIDDTVERSELLLGLVSAIYERDVQVVLEMSGIVVRTSEGENPYSGSSGGGLLSQMRANWRDGQTGIEHDLAHLFSGVNFDGSTIGVAYLNTVCTGSRYGVNDLRFSTNLGSLSGLISHEMGHNFSAPHCNGVNPCQIMCSGINGCNGLSGPSFAPVSIGAIRAHAASRNCLTVDTGSTLLLPVLDGFAGGSLDDDNWETDTTANVEVVLGAPSAPFALRLDRDDEIITGHIDPLIAAPLVSVGFFARETDLEAGDGLRLEHRTTATGREAWSTIKTFEATGSSDGRFAWLDAPLPLSATFRGVKLRLRPLSADADDVWHIDDFRVGAFEGFGAPFEELFDAALDEQTRWLAVGGTRLVESGDAGSLAAEIDGASALETFNVDLRFLIDGDAAYVRARPTGPAAGDMLLQFRDGAGVWTTLVSLAPSGANYRVGVAEVPASLQVQNSAMRVVVDGGGDDNWLVDALGVAVTPPASCRADLAAPAGTLDIADVVAFLSLFGAGDPTADFAAPDGVFDIADVVAFLSAFGTGCP